MSDNQILQHLPSVNKILQYDSVQELIQSYSHSLVVDEIQVYLDQLRTAVQNGQLSEEDLLREISDPGLILRSRLKNRIAPSLKSVVNASGVIIHTNIGRAPFSPEAATAIQEIAVGYSNLEYNLENGQRGHRDLHFQKTISRLLSSEAATVCNNNAAAVLLILNTLAHGKEVIVSRGELVEIGGSFRIPAIMERSGVTLKEVGTTNKTRISDYREAISEKTALILRVHPSNYQIVGFTHSPPISDLVELAHDHNIPLAEDAGSGLLFSNMHPALKKEPSIKSILTEGVDLVCFSGDKLLGGPQSGIIVGKKPLVDSIRKNPLMRACRVDKITYAALEWTLTQYETNAYVTTLPVQHMLSIAPEEIRDRAQRLAELLKSRGFQVNVFPGVSLIGGGSAPEVEIPTFLVAVTSGEHSVNTIERHLREFSKPILARIEDNQLILDLRTVFPDQEETIVSALAALVGSSKLEKTQSNVDEG
ncbi:MAG: L-seryl-tRNA(Sec) selenium transferase [Acidobacteriota bacterium]|nr:L-seryl-tRNA(Sec) selenium transferase [Acidobacteriota bacterium]